MKGSISLGIAVLLICVRAFASGPGTPIRDAGGGEARAITCALHASSVSAHERPKYETVRYDEDWSVLAASVDKRDFFDPMKCIPLTADGAIWLSLGGQIRERAEGWRNFLFGASTPKKNDTFLLSRFRGHGDLHLGKYLRLFGELKSALSTRRDLTGRRRPLDVDTLALQNGFAELDLPLGNDRGANLRLGRQEMTFGAQRLVSPLDWANSRRTFDGVTATVHAAGWRATGFWTRPVRIRKHIANDHLHSVEFYGVYAVGSVPRTRQGLDLYWLGLQQDMPTAGNGTTGRVDRHTLGGRVYGKLLGTSASFDLESAIQIGEVGDENIFAGMVSMTVTIPIAHAFWSPKVSAGFDYASGGGGGGGEVRTFNQLFPLGHAYLGYIDVVGRQNIIAGHAGLVVSPIKKSAVAATLHSFWRAAEDDALYNAVGGVVRPGSASNSMHVGTELDLTATYEVNPHLIALVGYSHFFAGSFIRNSGPADDVDFGYLQLTYTF